MTYYFNDLDLMSLFKTINSLRTFDSQVMKDFPVLIGSQKIVNV